MANEVEHMPLNDASKILKSLKSEKAQILMKMGIAFWHKPLFARFYMPNAAKQSLGPHHIDVMYAVQPKSRGIRHAIAAPRGSGKTTTHIICLVHHLVYIDWYRALDLQPNDFILVVGHKDGAYNICANVRGVLETNQRIIKFFGDFVGRTWNWKETRTPRGSYLKPTSLYGRLRGENEDFERPNLLLGSDMQKGADIDSPTIRDTELQLWKDDASRVGGFDGDDETQQNINILVEGTTLHDECIVNWCLDNPAYTGKKYPAIESFATRDALWNTWRDTYVDLPNENRHADAQKYYEVNRDEMLTGVKMLWPQGLSYYQCQTILISEGTGSFNREMMMDTDNPETQILPMKDAIYFTKGDDYLQRSDDRPVNMKEIIGVTMFWDWMGGKDAKQNCFACVCVVFWEGFKHTEEKCAYVWDVWIEKAAISRQVEVCFDMFAKYSTYPFDFAYESPSINEVIERKIYQAFEAERDKREKAGQPYDLIPNVIIQKEDKDNRISLMEPGIKNGHICFYQYLPKEFTDEMRHFPGHRFKDGPDGLKGALDIPAPTWGDLDREREYEKQRDKPYEFRF